MAVRYLPYDFDDPAGSKTPGPVLLSCQRVGFLKASERFVGRGLGANLQSYFEPQESEENGGTRARSSPGTVFVTSEEVTNVLNITK